MSADAWVALLGVFLVQLAIAWSYTLKVENRLSRIEAAIGIRDAA